MSFIIGQRLQFADRWVDTYYPPMFRRLAPIFALCAVISLSLPAISQAAWSVLEPPTQQYSPHPLVVDSVGNAYQLLQLGQYAVRPPGGSFSTRSTPGASIASYALDDAGSSVWLGQATTETVGVTRRSAGAAGTFGGTFDLGAGTAASIGVTPTGFELMTWGSTAPSASLATPQGTLLVATRGVGQSNPTTEALPGAPSVAYGGSPSRPLAYVVLGQDQSASIVFKTPTGAINVIERSAAGAWGTANPIATTLTGPVSVTVASNARGDGIAILSRTFARGSGQWSGEFHVATRQHDGTFGAASVVSAPYESPTLTGAVVATDGVPFVAIQTRYVIGHEFIDTFVYRRSGGTWSSTNYSSPLSLSASRDNARVGLARVVDQASSIQGLPRESRIRVRLGTSSSWDATETEPPQLTSASTSYAGIVGLFGDGRAIAVWTGEENTRPPQYRYGAELDDCIVDCVAIQPRRGGVQSVPPKVTRISVASGNYQVTKGWPITFTADASDADGQTPLTYQWRVDGGDFVAGGPSMTHTFTTLHSHSVSVMVTDTAGSTGSGSTSIWVEDGSPPPPPKPSGVIIATSPGSWHIESTLDQPLDATIDVAPGATPKTFVVTASAQVRPQLYWDQLNSATCVNGTTTTSLTCTVTTDTRGMSMGIEGTSHADTIVARGPSGDVGGFIDGGGGNDRIDVSKLTRAFWVDGQAGDDTILACGCVPATDDKRDPELRGGAGVDLLTFASSPTGVPRTWHERHLVAHDFETIVGTSKADWLRGGRASRIDAGGGNDTVVGPEVSSVVMLGAGNDTFRNNSELTPQRVTGGGGNDTYAGDTGSQPYFVCLDDRASVCPKIDGRKNEYDQVGADVENVDLSAGSGKDFIVGSPLANRLSGGRGDDGLVGGGGADVLHGGAGFDYASWEFKVLQKRPVRLSLDGKRNDGTRGEVLVDRSVEILVGSPFSDTITGSARGDGLYGYGGNDRLVGGTGYDLLDGGAGNDRIDARDGIAGDVVKCGAGRDTVMADRGDKVASDCEARA